MELLNYLLLIKGFLKIGHKQCSVFCYGILYKWRSIFIWGNLEMSNVIAMISDNIVQIMSAVITGVISYLGVRLKNIYQEYIQDKQKKDIVDKTIRYIEQTGVGLSCEEKKEKAKQKTLEWLNEKGLKTSDTELEILIESAVNCLKDKKA